MNYHRPIDKSKLDEKEKILDSTQLIIPTQQRQKTVEEVHDELEKIEKDEKLIIIQEILKMEESFISFIKDKIFDYATFDTITNSGKTISTSETYYDLESTLNEFEEATGNILVRLPHINGKGKYYSIPSLERENKKFILKEKSSRTGDELISESKELYEYIIDNFIAGLAKKQKAQFDSKRKDVIRQCKELYDKAKTIALIQMEYLPSKSEYHIHEKSLNSKEFFFVAMSVVQGRKVTWTLEYMYRDVPDSGSYFERPIISSDFYCNFVPELQEHAEPNGHTIYMKLGSLCATTNYIRRTNVSRMKPEEYAKYIVSLETKKAYFPEDAIKFGDLFIEDISSQKNQKN